MDDASNSLGSLITIFAVPFLERCGTRHARDRGSKAKDEALDESSGDISSEIVEIEETDASVSLESLEDVIIL